VFPRSVRATNSERTRQLPGDERIPTPIGSLTHAITIHTARENVWPWIVQMGAGSRAGWYSYDFLDNRHHRSADHIEPHLQQVSVGTLFPALPGRTDGFHVLEYEPERNLVLGWVNLPDRAPTVTWAFVLEEASEATTRLVTRARGGSDYRFHGLPAWMSSLVVRLVHFVMQRKQLLGIAHRAESRQAATHRGAGTEAA